VTFTSAASDPDGDDLLYVWDFGDGVKAGGESAVHTYTRPGTYNATITVTDVPGARTATAAVQIVVKAKAAVNGGETVQPPDAGDVAGEESTQPRVRVSKRYALARVIRRGLRYRVGCETACRVTSVLRSRGRRLGASHARRVAAGGTRAIVVRLNARARRRLAAAGRVKAHLVVTVRTAEGVRTLRTAVILR